MKKSITIRDFDMFKYPVVFTVLIFIVVFSCNNSTEAPLQSEYPFTPPSKEPMDTFEQNLRLARTVNLGNYLEAPRDESWGVEILPIDLQRISEAGFTAVRVPIRWSDWAMEEPPYTILATFFSNQVNPVVNSAIKNGLAVIINIHHFEELYDDPDGQKERFLAIWDQIARYYRKYPDECFFEILNEPHGNLVSAVWNDMLPEVIDTVRASNPYRTLIIGGANWNGLYDLRNLKLPEEDRGIIGTFHYYSPFQFTHQGASWVDGADAWLGTTWYSTPTQKQAVLNDMEVAAQWSESADRPVFMGEFGSYSAADQTSRMRWTYFVSRSAEEQGISWGYWEYCSGFGVFDKSANQWRDWLLNALIPFEE
jgi:endoglucanase